jgi:CubicO group peptidase (beta-lactamase class C family)
MRYGDPQEVGLSAERVARVRGLAERWVADGLTPALVVLAARRGIVFLHEAFGRLGPEPGAPALPLDALFPIASVTKPITATAVMCLVEDGLLGLNRPVQEYLPEFVGEGKEAVMVHHLLTHTAGLDDQAVNAHVPPIPPEAHPAFREFPFAYDLVAGYSAPLSGPPGQEMVYSAYGYNLLDEIVGRVSGEPFAAFATRRVLEPLGMRDTFFAGRGVADRRIVRAPADSVSAVLNGIEVEQFAVGSGGAFSTARDLAVFGEAFLGGGAPILSPASAREMTRNQIRGIAGRYRGESFPEASWGLGWAIGGDVKAPLYPSLLSPHAFGHGGYGGKQLWCDPETGLLCVYLSIGLELHPGSAVVGTCADLFTDAIAAAA